MRKMTMMTIATMTLTMTSHQRKMLKNKTAPKMTRTIRKTRTTRPRAKATLRMMRRARTPRKPIRLTTRRLPARSQRKRKESSLL